MPIAAPAGRRRPSCWSGWSTSIAHDTGIDRVELRRKNFIPADAFPYQTPVALQYDSGDYHDDAEGALKSGRLGRFRGAAGGGRRRAASCAASASPPTSRPAASRRRPWSARSARAPACTRCANIRVHPTGSVTVFTGTHSHGQGHETTLAQLVVRPARRADRSGRGRAWRHREDPVRHGHLRQPQPRGRRLGDGEGDGQDHRQGQEDRRPSDGSLGRGHRVRGRHLHASPAPTRRRR